MSFESQSLSIFILFLQLSMNSAKVLLNSPLLSMKEHLQFAGILIVRTKTLLATGVPTNSLSLLIKMGSPLSYERPVQSAVTFTQYGKVGSCAWYCLYELCTFLLCRCQDFDDRAWPQGRYQGTILSLWWNVLLGCWLSSWRGFHSPWNVSEVLEGAWPSFFQ